jgi:D-xylose transport system substrate-binding protein
MSRFRLLALIAAFVGVMALALAACGDDDDDGGGGGGGGGDGGGGGGSIALLLPESKTARYESQDRPNFEKKVKELCSDCDIIYSNADQDAAKQQQQAEAAITKGAKVLVLDPVDAASAGAIVTRAKQSDIPVISYDRLITDADIDYYISFDNEQVGKLQGESLVKKLTDDGAKGDLIMINGAPTDNNAKLFKEGAHSVIDSSDYKIAKEYDTPDWSPDKAQQEMEQAITAVGKDGFVGVYAANDGTAGGAIAAMKGNGVDPKKIPTTGQDAELAAIQRILIGEQYMTVYKAIKPEAEQAAELAVQLAKGETPPAPKDKVDNGTEQVPSILLTPVAVTKDNINDTIVKDGFWSADEICTGNTPVLSLKGVSKSFGPVQALSDVDFEVRPAEVVALVGDNGAGKSTLVKTIAGIHPPDGGTISFEGNEVTIHGPSDAVHLGIATVYQDLALCDNLDVVENLFLGREERSEGPAGFVGQLDEVDMEKQTGELLENLAVTITSVRAEVGTMSGGQRQQVAIARSLLGEPKLVMLDEPTAALGVRQTAQVLELIKRLRERGYGVVVISHNLADVFEVADRIYVLRLGQKAGDFKAGETNQDEVVRAITVGSGNGGGQK